MLRRSGVCQSWRRGIEVQLQCACQNPSLYFERPGLAHCSRQFVQTAAAGHHVVDQDDAFSSDVHVDCERVTQVALARFEIEPGLRRRVAYATTGIAPPWDANHWRQPTRDFRRLIEAASGQTGRVQGHRNQTVGATIEFETLCHVLGKVGGQRDRMGVFALLYQGVDGKRVGKGCLRSVETRRPFQACAADLAIERGKGALRATG